MNKIKPLLHFFYILFVYYVTLQMSENHEHENVILN